jgi:hypothetical protein
MGWIKSSYEDKYLIFKKKIYNFFFLPEEQKSCCFKSLLHNRLSDWHEICYTTRIVRFYILYKNDMTIKHKLHSQSQDLTLKFTSRMNLVL